MTKNQFKIYVILINFTQIFKQNKLIYIYIYIYIKLSKLFVKSNLP